MISCRNVIVLNNIRFVRKLHLDKRVLNCKMWNRSVLITCVIPKNQNPNPIILKSSMIMLPPDSNFENLQVNAFYKRNIGDLYDKCNKTRTITFFSGMLPSLRCRDEKPLQQTFGTEYIANTEDEPSKDQSDDLGRSHGEEASDWEDEEDYDDEEDDQ